MLRSNVNDLLRPSNYPLIYPKYALLRTIALIYPKYALLRAIRAPLRGQWGRGGGGGLALLRITRRAFAYTLSSRERP